MVGLYCSLPLPLPLPLSLFLSLFPRVHTYSMHTCTSCIDWWAAVTAAITTVLQHLRVCDAHMKTHMIACIRIFVARETLCRATSVTLTRKQPRFSFFLSFLCPSFPPTLSHSSLSLFSSLSCDRDG